MPPRNVASVLEDVVNASQFITVRLLPVLLNDSTSERRRIA